MNKQKEQFPILYHKGRTGKLFSWRIWTEKDEIVTEYGADDGKKQIARKKATPKNVGRSNATDANEQALLEAKSMWTNKVERKYSESSKDAQEEVFLPMLAHDFLKRGKNVQYPVDVQIKLDGCRCLAYWEDGHVQLMSRGGKPWNVPHIAKELEDFLPKNTILDGELYQHGVGFQTITKLIKKERPESKNIMYLVYDSPINDGVENNIWINRRDYLAELFKTIPPSIRLVTSHTISSFKEILKKQSEFLEGGYEGTIIRLHNGIYEFGYRSPSLLKYKEFDDEEFQVIGFEEGIGRYEGCVTWFCKTKDGKEFKSVPKGTLEEKAEWFKNGKKYIGKWLKVKYFGLSDDGIPRFPVAIGFRDMEMDK